MAPSLPKAKNYIIHYGNPIYYNPRLDRPTIRYIWNRFIYDNDNDHGFGHGALLDTASPSKPAPVLEPLNWRISCALIPKPNQPSVHFYLKETTTP